MKQRFEGRNLEEALSAAAAAFGVESYQLDYHVAVEKRGFLGGVKRVVIEAEADEGRQPESNASRDAGMLASSEIPAGATVGSAAPARSAGGRVRRERESGGHGGRGGARSAGRGGRGERGPRRERSGARGDSIPAAPRRRRGPVELAPDQAPRGPFAAAIAEWCEKLVDLGGFDLEVRTFEEDINRLVVRFYGADADLLTDRGGALLDSIQVLATKSFSEKEGAVDLEMDVAGFKEQRASELDTRARALADEVRGDGRERILPPMSPVERRLIHLALAEDPELETVSRGDGFLKRVVIRRRAESGGDEPTREG